MTDVNISIELMTNAFRNQFDVALLISADSDLVGPIPAVQRLFNQKRIVVAFPPSRFSEALMRVANGEIYINRDALSKSLFPDQVIKPDGYVLRRPMEWR